MKLQGKMWKATDNNYCNPSASGLIRGEIFSLLAADKTELIYINYVFVFLSFIWFTIGFLLQSKSSSSASLVKYYFCHCSGSFLSLFYQKL